MRTSRHCSLARQVNGVFAILASLLVPISLFRPSLLLWPFLALVLGYCIALCIVQFLYVLQPDVESKADLDLQSIIKQVRTETGQHSDSNKQSIQSVDEFVPPPILIESAVFVPTNQVFYIFAFILVTSPKYLERNLVPVGFGLPLSLIVLFAAILILGYCQFNRNSPIESVFRITSGKLEIMIGRASSIRPERITECVLQDYVIDFDLGSHRVELVPRDPKNKVLVKVDLRSIRNVELFCNALILSSLCKLKSPNLPLDAYSGY